MISTIHASVAFCKVFKACYIHSRGCLSHHISSNIAELTLLWSLISRMVPTNALVEHGGFHLQAAILWSHSSLCTPDVHYIVSWWPSTLKWIDSHLIECLFLYLLLLGLQTFWKCTFWGIFWVTALAALRWTNWCLHCYFVPAGGALNEAPVGRLDSDRLTPCWGVCGAIICRCGRGEADDNEKKWEVLRNI